MICNRINLLFLRLCVKLELMEQRSHKVETVMSIEFDIFLLVSLQWYVIFLLQTRQEDQISDTGTALLRLINAN